MYTTRASLLYPCIFIADDTLNNNKHTYYHVSIKVDYYNHV